MKNKATLKPITATYEEAKSSGGFARFFSKRNSLNLDRDVSSHRRYAWLYEDMLT